MPEEITIVSTISEGRTFKILKARRGTKFVTLKVATHPDGMTEALLKKEYEIGLTLSAPQIVTTIDFCPDTPAGPAIILEYIEGTTLQEITTGKIQSGRILKDILSGVEYLHHKGIQHNDLKPSNIIITPEGYARIIDFGLSISDDSIYSGCIGGTEGYSAPEILEGTGPSGAASDIYSIGCIIRFLYGIRKFRKIVENCTAYNPSSRYQTIDELRKAISRKGRTVTAICIAAAVTLSFLTALIPTGTKIATEIRVNDLEEQYHVLLDSPFVETIKLMSKQQYKELAVTVCDRKYFYTVIRPLMDSLNTKFPISETGEIAPEISAICAVNKEHQKIIDSVLNTLPTMRKLPRKRQKALRDSLLQALSPSQQ